VCHGTDTPCLLYATLHALPLHAQNDPVITVRAVSSTDLVRCAIVLRCTWLISVMARCWDRTVHRYSACADFLRLFYSGVARVVLKAGPSDEVELSFQPPGVVAHVPSRFVYRALGRLCQRPRRSREQQMHNIATLRCAGPGRYLVYARVEYGSRAAALSDPGAADQGRTYIGEALTGTPLRVLVTDDRRGAQGVGEWFHAASSGVVK
jgi:hypothetical protein